jgi:hypothetical protein
MSEPPIGIEPMTYALRETRSLAVDALAALIAREIALIALAALGLPGDPVHARGPASPAILLLCVDVADDMDPRSQADPARGRG